ncbi:cysteine desulfurase-like protein [Nannocystaceae bacterium ST9]
MSLDLEFVRRQFPVLSEHSRDWALLDNAGGSVLPRQVQARITAHLERSMVQLGASYPLSQQASASVAAGHAAIETLLGAAPGEVVLAPSTTLAARLLARALRPRWRTGDAVIVSELDHEANRGPWRALAETGIEVRTWPLRRESASLELDDLEPLLDERARLVCFTHCANVVGGIHDVRAIAERVHAAGAEVCVDGVAYAPHRLVDVRALGVDYYLVSLYKIFGPHLAALWGRRELLEQAKGQNHDFIGEHELPYKFEPGSVSHELAVGLPGILDYLAAIELHHVGGLAEDRRAGLARSFELFAAHEARLAERLLAWLRERAGVRILGPDHGDPALRVPTIAFVSEGRASSSIPPLLEREQLAIRWGHFYAPQAIRALGLDEREGVVRVSMVHYNTLAEVDRLIAALDRVL